MSEGLTPEQLKELAGLNAAAPPEQPDPTLENAAAFADFIRDAGEATPEEINRELDAAARALQYKRDVAANRGRSVFDTLDETTVKKAREANYGERPTLPDGEHFAVLADWIRKDTRQGEAYTLKFMVGDKVYEKFYMATHPVSVEIMINDLYILFPNITDVRVFGQPDIAPRMRGKAFMVTAKTKPDKNGVPRTNYYFKVPEPKAAK